MPAGGGQPTQNTRLAGSLIEMERLRVELLGKFDDLFGGDVALAELDHHALGKVLICPSDGCHFVEPMCSAAPLPNQCGIASAQAAAFDYSRSTSASNVWRLRSSMRFRRASRRKVPCMSQTALADFLDHPQSQVWRALPFFSDGTAERVVDAVAKRSEDGVRVLPEPANIFNALRLTSPATTRVAILGQDPYPTPGHANGLAFSYVGSGSLPASLRNIFKELSSDLGNPARTRGDLSDWARQGVLLLNTALTVEAGATGAHMKFGWQELTRQAVRAVSDHADHCVFILWGDKARAYSGLIDPTKHLVLASAHPSPLSARNGFFGSRPFSQANAWLVSKGLPPIDWQG